MRGKSVQSFKTVKGPWVKKLIFTKAPVRAEIVLILHTIVSSRIPST